MKIRNLVALIGASLLAFVSAGCASFSWSDRTADALVGEAETLEQRVYRAAGIYVIAADFICEYSQTPSAYPEVIASLQRASNQSYETLVRARAMVALDSELALVLDALSYNLSAMTLNIVTEDSSEPSSDMNSTYVLNRISTLLGNYIQYRYDLQLHRGNLASMVMEGRNPNIEEWDAVMFEAAEANSCES
jgi:hypothetical protein